MRQPWALLLTLAAVALLPAAVTAVESEELSMKQQSIAKRSKIAGDIACGMCRFVAEDLWTTLVSDWAAESKRGELARSRGAHRTAREMLEQLCVVNSPMLPHFVDMYDIQGCSAEGEVPACGKPGRQWYLQRVRTPPPPPPRPDAKEMNAQYQAALGEALGAMMQEDGAASMASALGAALGGKEMVDMDALNELLDTAAVEELDSDEDKKLRRIVSDALDKRYRHENPPPPPPPPPRAKSAEERQWHLQAYTDACAGHLRAVEDLFADVVGEQLAAHGDVLAEAAALAATKSVSKSPERVESVMGELDNAVKAGRVAVAASSCVEVCEGEKPASVEKKGPTRQQPEKKKTKKKTKNTKKGGAKGKRKEAKTEL